MLDIAFLKLKKLNIFHIAYLFYKKIQEQTVGIWCVCVCSKYNNLIHLEFWDLQLFLGPV